MPYILGILWLDIVLVFDVQQECGEHVPSEKNTEEDTRSRCSTCKANKARSGIAGTPTFTHPIRPLGIPNDQCDDPHPWAAFLDAIEASNPSIRATVITDFFSIERYEQVVEEKRRGRLPGVGRAYKPDMTDEEAARAEGANQFTVNFDQLKQAWSKNEWIERNTLIAVAGGEKDGASGLRNATACFVVAAIFLPITDKINKDEVAIQ